MKKNKNKSYKRKYTKKLKKSKKYKGGSKKEDERYCKYISVYGILLGCKGIENLYYVQNDSVNSFSIPNKPFVLVTHHGDSSIPNSCLDKANEILNSPNLIHWFSQNLTKLDNSKLTPIPLGINYQSLYLQEEGNLWWGEGGIETPVDQEKMLDTFNKIPFDKREIKIYTNFSHSLRENFIHNSKNKKADRVLALEQIPKDLIVIEEHKAKRKKSWENIGKYAFAASPLGAGLDCHRTWEILALGAIPIVKTSSLDVLYDDLPVLIVQEWSDINLNLLKDTIDKFKDKNFNMDKITSKYWLDKIKEKCPV